MLKKNRSAVIYEFTLEAPSGALDKMEAIEPQIFRCRCLRRPADERRGVLDAPDVVLLRLL